MSFQKIILSTERNYGIDLLRLVAMFFIVILHVLGQGGVIDASEGHRYALGWLMKVFSYCAVDCYAIISGFVGYSDQEKPFHYHKYITMWLQVFCYSFGITLAAYLIKAEAIGFKALVYSAFPVATNHYWYFSSYTGLFFLIPVLNRLVRSQNKQELHRTILILISIFPHWQLLPHFWTRMHSDLRRDTALLGW